MYKWIRLFYQQHLGVWVLGLVLFAVQEIPYLVMPFFKLQQNPIMTMQESSQILNLLEKALDSLCIAMMIFLVHEKAAFFSIKPGKERICFCITAGVLLANFAGWLLYFTGRQTFFIMMTFLVALPPLYYVMIGLWRNNGPLTITGCVFLLVHFAHVWGNLRMG